MMKILVTAFEPFNEIKENVSLEVLKLINRPEVDKLILPVSYDSVQELLEEKIKAGQYAAVICLGQAGGKVVRIEQFALNYQHAKISDNDQKCYQYHHIIPNGNLAYETNIDIKSICQHLESEYPVEISTYAGTYVCNTTYYHALKMTGGKALFIHLPYFTGQSGIVSLPTISLETLREIINKIIDIVYQIICQNML